METITNEEHSRLREIGLMVAYLKDEVSLEEATQIEILMEQDEMYRLSMETLAQNSFNQLNQIKLESPSIEQAFPDLLLKAKDQFILNLQNNQGGPGTNEGNGKGPWRTYLGIIGLGLMLALSLYLIDTTPALHKAPVQNLVPNQGKNLAASLIASCGEQLGIGQGQSNVTVFSTMVDQYATARYAQASHQFGELARRPNIDEDCMAKIRFFEAQSYMGLHDHTQAAALMNALLATNNLESDIANACNWYLGNIALNAGDESAASQYFSNLLESKNSPDSQHLKSLIEQNYMEDAEKYMERMK